MKIFCQHCATERYYGSIARQLCYVCAKDKRLLRAYPSNFDPKTGGAKRGSLANCNPVDPSEPTTAPPGSEEKILAMQARAERGEKIFHENDLTCFPDPVY